MQFKLPLLLIATFFIDSIWTKDCAKLKSNTKLFCYYGDIKETENFCQCTHVVLPETTELKTVEKIRKQNADVKILLTVSEFNEKLVALLKGTKVDGLELNLKKIDSKNDLTDFISTVKSKLGSDHYIAVSVPSKTESLAKNFDFKELSKHADVFILNTAFLGASQNVTFHPSRLSGLWDMQNTDSMVDLVSGLGAPLSKIVIAAPVQAFSFTLQNEEYTAPGSPATEVKSINRKELCDLMQQKDAEWTLERDQDQAGPYIFRGKQWIAFEDDTSIDIKTKYARVRSLAGVALKDVSQDSETKCGSSILNAAFKGLSKQARAPRGAVLHTLEREILSPSSIHSSSIHDSPFRISRIIDTEGKIHVVRQDTRTEFECSRQGYFVHPRSCNRFYRCVKFDQRTEDYNVFEFDCPAGLTFDEKTEVCVWPGSLPHASACSGSSEIAPVPQKRFTCPSEPGYYADPENCRWFFACLDHGEPTMQAYEFRCPFGLVFDEEKLLCEWPWMVPKCGLRLSVTQNYYGGISTNINQYDGLGVLQTVKLGGLNGPIHAAEAKTYSNVGFVSLADKTSTNGLVLSQNSARFIDVSRRLGLTLKATQSLYNAGLLSEKLAAIGLTQADFGLNDANLGLQQNSQGFGQQLHSTNFGVSGVEFGSQQNQNYQYSGQNLNAFSSDQSTQLVNGKVVLNSGLGLSASSGEYQTQSNIDLLKSTQGQGSSVSYNNLYHQSSSGEIQRNQAEYNKNFGQNVYLNLDQSSSGGYQTQSNIDLLKSTQGQGSSVSYNNLYQQSSSGEIQNQAEYNKNSGQNVYLNIDQSSQDQLQQQQILLGQNSFAQSGQNQLTLENAGVHQADRGNSYSQSSINLDQTQGHLSLQQIDGLKELNLENNQANIGGNAEYQLKYNRNLDTTSQGFSQNQDKYNANSKASGYSTSYVNLGQSSGSQFQANQHISNQQQSQQGQLNLNQETIQSESAKSTTSDRYQNVEQLNIGVDQYRQNSGLLLQNVEINGAAGTYIDDHAQSNFNAGVVDSSDFSHVTPHSVSHATVSSFESIVSATPLKTIDNYQQKESAGIEYAINGLAEAKQSNEFEQNKKNEATSYQFIQSQQPSYVSSTPSPSFVQQGGKKLSTIQYSTGHSSVEYNQPEISLNIPQIYSTSRPLTQKVHIKTVSSPSVTLQGESRITYSQKAPTVSFASSEEQGLINGQSYSQDGGYNYEKPSVNFEDKPQVLISEKTVVSSTPAYIEKVAVTPSTATSYSYSNRAESIQNQPKERQQVYVQQPQVVVASSPSTGSSSSYFRQESTKNSYEIPQIIQQQPRIIQQQPQIIQQQPQIIHQQQQQIIQQQPQIIQHQQQIVQQPQVSYGQILQQQPIIAKRPEVVATSYNYINQNGPQISVNQPQTFVKQSERVATSYNYVKPVVKSEVLVEQPQVVLRKPEGFVSSYVQPTVQTNIVYEQPKISIKQPATVVESYNYVKPSLKTEIVQEAKPAIPQSFSYTQQNTRGRYVQEQPQRIETTFQRPSVSTSFNVNTGYKYEKPIEVFEEGPRTVQQQIVQPVIQKQENRYNTEQKVTSYQYFQPVVQQPRGFSKTDFQQEAVKTYSYSNPVRTQYIAKPATIVSTNYQTPAFKSEQIEFQGYGYPRPQVQFVEEPKPVVTSYENKQPVVETPIVPKKAYVLGNSFQYQKLVPTVHFSNEKFSQKTPRPTFISTINSFTPQKVSSLPQREFIYYDSRLDNAKQTNYFQTSPVVPSRPSVASYTPSVYQNIDVKGYKYPKPSIKFEETPRTSEQESYQYFQSHQVKQVPLRARPQIVSYTTPRPNFVSTIKSIVGQKLEPLEEQYLTTPAQIQYLESTTSKPISTVEPVQQTIGNVEINGYIQQKPQIQSYQYNQQAKTQQQNQVVVEDFVNQQYNRPVYYSTERPTSAPVTVQKNTPVTQEYFYYDSRLTSTQGPEVKYVETSTRAPIIQKAQRVEFEGYDYPKPQVAFEEPKVVSYGNKVPVAEVPIVPKKAYVTTGQGYSYNENVKVNIEQETIKPIVLENYVASNYREHSKNVQLQQVDYVTPRPTYISTVSSLIEEKPRIDQVFRYSDSRSTPRTRVVSQKTRTSSSRGYSYPKPKVQLLEEPQQVLNTVEVNKEAKPIILENYVSPDYNKYDVSIQSSTPGSIQSQNTRQEILRYDNRQRSGYVRVTQAPKEVNIEVTSPAPAIVQTLEQEQPVEPFFYYDSRLSSTQGPTVEVVQEKEEAPQVFRQEISSYGSRFSSARPSVTIVEQEPIQKVAVEQQYSLEVSTEQEGLKYQIETKEPSSTYLPIRKRIKVTKPSRKYLPTSTTPTVEYSSRTTPVTISNEYLPVSSSEARAEGGISVENYENFELVRKKQRPVKVVKIVRPRVKTVVVKKNDFNPFLSAKLGAQCTCTSNTIELRKEPLRIEVLDEDDDNENDDSILVEKKDGEAFVIENYESERLDSSTAEPEIYIKSSTVEIPSSTFRLRKVNRGRSRAQNVVVEDVSSRRKSKVNIEASDVNINTSRVRIKTKKIDIVSDDDAEINIESGRSESRLESGSDESIEVTSKNFDRYGPGGLRSATETLQGIDCQRAGLFRHPTQCNKFYSCRWDCKKSKFTLHVFNCPVHLTFDNNLGACNWPSQGPACLENTLLPSE